MQAVDFAASRILTRRADTAAGALSGAAYTSGAGVDFTGSSQLAETAPPGQEAPPPPLHLTTPADPEEVEADRFADAALAACVHPAAPLSATSGAPQALPSLSRVASTDTAGDREDEGAVEEPLLPPAKGPHSKDEDDPLAAVAAAGPGTALAEPVRQRLEPLLGLDLGQVRIHDDARAHELSEGFAASAFARGRDIFFSKGAYAPGTVTGTHLLLHELAHVVQQTGAGDARPVIARGPLSGRGAHGLVENLLTTHHKDKHLIKEGVLPGGNTNSSDQLDKLGFPDLLWSSAGNSVPWVQGHFADDGSFSYLPIKRLPVGRKNPESAGGKSARAPTVDDKGTFTGDFPKSFGVAEIKPVGILNSAIDKAGEGFAQSNNYRSGFRHFTEQANKDKKTTVVSTGVSLTHDKEGPSVLGKPLLPPAVDYRNFAADAANEKPDKPNLVGEDKGVKVRYWLYPLQKEPVLFYFHLPHPYKVSDYTTKLDEVFHQLESLRRRLGTKQGLRRKKRKGSRRGRLARKTDWPAEHKKWEEDRKNWDEKTAKPFLKTDAAKAIEQKSKVDSFIGLPSKDDSAAAKRRKEFRQVEIFSGKTGQILGDIRYKLAPVFDKIAPFLEKFTKKLEGLVGRFKKKRTLSLSWAQTILDAVMASLGTAVEEAVNQLMSKFTGCITGMIDSFIESFMKDLGEELAKPFEDAKAAFFNWLGTDEESFGQLMTDIEASIAKYEEIAETVMDVKRLVDEIKVYEVAIRVIVQAASCVSPPLLGCLWGAVAQLALPAMVDLAAQSDLFQDKVVRPLVQDLLGDVLDEPFSRIVSESIKAIGLGKWAEGVEECGVKRRPDIPKIIRQSIKPRPKLNDAEFLKKRDEWAKKNGDALLDAAVPHFIKKDGKPATKEDLKRLMEQTRDLLDTAGGMDQALANARRGDGKISLEKFAEWAQGRKSVSGTPTGPRGSNPRSVPGSGWTDDNEGTPDAAQVRSKLAALDLAGTDPRRLTEILEGSREDDGRVNLDQVVRRAQKHLERQEIKKTVEAKQPARPGVPKQPGAGFTKGDGTKAGNDEVVDLLDSLAKSNLGETAAAEKVAAATRSDGSVDATAAKAGVEGAGGQLAPLGDTGQGQDKPQDKPQEKQDGGSGTPSDRKPSDKKPSDEQKRPGIIIETCIGMECRPRGGGPRRSGGSGIEFGPQTMQGPDGEPRTTGPGVQVTLPGFLE